MFYLDGSMYWFPRLHAPPPLGRPGAQLQDHASTPADISGMNSCPSGTPPVRLRPPLSPLPLHILFRGLQQRDGLLDHDVPLHVVHRRALRHDLGSEDAAFDVGLLSSHAAVRPPANRLGRNLEAPRQYSGDLSLAQGRLDHRR